MIKVALAGGRGYVGEELIRLLSDHPNFEVVFAGSNSAAGQRVDELYPSLETQLAFQDLAESTLKNTEADVWVIAQPNGKAADFVATLDGTDAKFIDISSDYRFDKDWVYGLPERNSQFIRGAARVSNPGCYATATQLALLPLLGEWTTPPSAFGISGFSGAGRTPNEKNDPKRLADNIIPYSLDNHMHQREVSHQLDTAVRLMPHVASFFRGITVTVDVRLSNTTDSAELLTRYRKHYQDHSLIEIRESIPEIRNVTETNLAVVGGFSVDPDDPTRVAIVSVIDNLRKGAASQAIQNMNLMFELEPTTGLLP